MFLPSTTFSRNREKRNDSKEKARLKVKKERKKYHVCEEYSIRIHFTEKELLAFMIVLVPFPASFLLYSVSSITDNSLSILRNLKQDSE